MRIPTLRYVRLIRAVDRTASLNLPQLSSQFRRDSTHLPLTSHGTRNVTGHPFVIHRDGFIDRRISVPREETSGNVSRHF